MYSSKMNDKNSTKDKKKGMETNIKFLHVKWAKMTKMKKKTARKNTEQLELSHI